MKQQIEALTHILNHGSVTYGGRNGGTISVYGTTERYSPVDGVPIPTTKSVNPKTVAVELEWFLLGKTSNRWLNERGVKIWDQWDVALMGHDELLAHIENTDLVKYNKLINLTVYRQCKSDSERLDIARPYALEQGIHITTGELGPVYGAMFRAWPVSEGITIDQITDLDMNLSNMPMSRRHVINLWNPALLPDESKTHVENAEAGKQLLPPCHMSQQVMIEEMELSEILQVNNLDVPILISALSAYLPNDLYTTVIELMSKASPYITARLHELTTSAPTSIVERIRRYAVERSVEVTPDTPIQILIQMLSELDLDFRNNMLLELKSLGYKIRKVHLQFYMRSNDAPVGRPFNVFSYYLLKEIIANAHNFESGDLIHNTGIAHIYLDQVDAVMTQLGRVPTTPPTLKWNRKLLGIADFRHTDFELVDYNPQKFIPTPVSA